MEINLILGSAMMGVCLTIQCVVVSVLLRLLFVLKQRRFIKTSLLGMSSVLIVVMMIMLLGNLLQITLWAWLFLLRAEFNQFTTAFYHSMVNFTTLGYGDLVMSKQSRLLGALEAANGVLMFGLTTSVVFAVLSELMRRTWDDRLCQDPFAEQRSR